MTAAHSPEGLTDTNVVTNRVKLLEWLSGAYKGDCSALMKVLQVNPDAMTDKKVIMKKTGHESSIKSTSNQGLGSVIDNMPYYVDSCAWWIKGWDVTKYLKSLTRDKKRTRRKPVPRLYNR